MLLENTVISFYKNHNLIPNGKMVMCSAPNHKRTLSDAKTYGAAFEAFVDFSLSPVNNEFGMNIESWEELFNCYCFFMVGYSGNKL